MKFQDVGALLVFDFEFGSFIDFRVVEVEIFLPDEADMKRNRCQK